MSVQPSASVNLPASDHQCDWWFADQSRCPKMATAWFAAPDAYCDKHTAEAEVWTDPDAV